MMSSSACRLFSRFPHRALAPAAFALSILSTLDAGAQTPGNPTAIAQLGKTEAAVGEAVRLQVSINSAMVDLPDPEIYVDGLTIRFTGKQTRFESINLSTSVSTQLNWIVIPQRPGDFEIPALSFLADGRKVTTEPVKLRAVAGGPATAPPSQPFAPQGQPSQNRATPGASPAVGNEESFIAELRLPAGRSEFFVGELIPAEIVFGADSRINASIKSPPQIGQKDFSTRKLSEPIQGREDRGGRAFSTVTYRTAIAPIKSGEIDLPQVELPIIFLTREPGRPRPPMGRDFDPFDPASVDRLFEEFFNDDPFAGMRALRREVTLTTAAGRITVKPLPEAGRPASFDGAVGKFSMVATATPARPAAGDPVQIKIEIHGEGNFDTVTAPRLDGLRGWRVYPASSRFSPSDDLGSAGTKTFEIVLVPGPDAVPIDSLEFSYFDPSVGEYRTVQSAPLGIRPEGAASDTARSPTGQAAPAGSAPPQPSPNAAAAPGSVQADPSPTPDPAPFIDDLLHIQTDRPDRPRPFNPPWLSPLFIGLNGSLLLLVAAFLLGRFFVSRFRSPESLKRRALALERARLVATLRSSTSAEADLLSSAAELIEAHGAAVASEERAWILSQRDRLRYGAGRADLPSPAELRARLLDALNLR